MNTRRNGALQRAKDSYRRILLGTGAIALAILVAAIAIVVGGLPFLRLEDAVWVLVSMAVAELALLRWGMVQLGHMLDGAAREQQALLDNAYRDALTGAHTRSHFLRELHDTLADLGRPVAYLQIDMDNLKVLNDAGGHAAGDQALVHLVRTLRQLLPGALIGRLGGDEFGIALEGQDNKAALLRLAERLLAALAQPVSFDGRQVRLSATIGLAVWPHDAIGADELVSKADIALYKGKKSGRALAVAFDPELLADERHKRFIERDLRAAILLNELEVHYQPIFSAIHRQVITHEALVRWQHQVRGRIMPAEFIAIAEQSDLIDKLGDWVLRRALADLPALGSATVSVNVSPVQLRRPDFADLVADALADARLGGDRLVIEVTESLQMQAGPVDLRNIALLRKAGVKVAIDDFGAGFASLGYLRGLSYDSIKIDRSYVANLPGSRIDGLIVSAICKIGRAMRVEVVAEGIETEEQLAFLERAGAGALQGFFLAPPAALADLRRGLPVAA